MAKKYAAEKMIKASRYREYYPTLNETMQKQVLSRMDGLVKENGEYCDKGNYGHLSNIFAALAIYEVLQKNGRTKEEALDTVSHAMWDFVEKTTAGKYRKLFSKKGMLKIIGKLLPKMFEKGSGKGWRYQWHTDKVTDSYLQFECHECIYPVIYKKYGTPELGPMFCYVDDINYGSIPGVTFTRNHTLCRDGQSCDFLFTK